MALFTKLPNWASILITVIATIIVVGLVAWGAYTLVKSPPPELPEGEEVVEEKEEALPEEPEDEFADWKIYRNEEYGFEMKYPDDWTAEKLFIDEEIKDNVIVLSGGKISEAVTAPTKDVIISFVENPMGLSVEQKVEQSCDKPKGWCKYYQNPKEILVGGVRALKYEDIPGELSYTVVYLSRDSQFVIISTNNFVPENILNQILSTFKFLEPDETAGWETYRNEEYGFEMKYPEGDYQFRDFAYSFRLEDSSDKPVIEMEILSDQPDKKSFEDFAVDAVKDSCGASGPPGGDWYCTEIIEQNLYTNKSNITSYEIFMTRVHELRGEVEEIGPEGGFIFEIPGPVDKRAIYLKIGSYSYSADNLELLKKMVDTFKFLD